MCDNARAAALGCSSNSGGFCALGPLRAAFICPPWTVPGLPGYRRPVSAGRNSRCASLIAFMATSQDVGVVSVANNDSPVSAGRARLIVVLGALIALGPLSASLYLPALP